MTPPARYGVARLLASCFGLGRLGPAPGTNGSLFGLALFALLLAPAGVAVQIVATLTVTVVGALAASAVERQLGQEDPQEVVIDELAGMWLSLLGTTAWSTWVLAFVLFRLFDVRKPFPVRQAERLHGGWGIMMDDIAAGLYALLLVQGARALGWVP